MSEVTHATASGAHRLDKDASSNMDPHADFHVSMTTYWVIFAGLIFLLIVTVVAAFIPLGPLNMPVAMLIASVKAGMVILYFMHVKFASRLTKVFVAASFLWLAILFVLGFADYISREWLSNSRGWNDNPVKSQYDAGTAAYHATEGGGHGDGHPGPGANTGDKHPGDPAAGEAAHGAPPSGSEKGPGRPGSR